ncbi:hypothetical protein SAMN05892883_2661 [Jatrophihabitans sp. GAS493]|uniref:methionine synthase n=1 Tax=Jatrophihabitans sp. GAS493 TaxID=1907575 RepID=UPI000BB915D4|nr:methionine synthase [Jatrophihabitans sp. GAS493]SOD73370.1 hypothetical protein SAMN05892883_2661 [Jatrophihabitans sp. GAS493]
MTSTAEATDPGSTWPAGAATAGGSLPGQDPLEAVRLVFGELGSLPFLPELPQRGAGADMIGRGASLLVALPVEIVPSGWRLTDHPGRDLRRANDFLSRDLDALQLQAEGYRGPLKVQVPGPWTLAASLELPSGHRAVSDRGATRDLAESLTEGVRLHLEELGKRVPGASLVLQVDEPSLPTVLAGQVPTASGYGSIRAVESAVAEQLLGQLLAVAPAGGRVVHCCAEKPPLAIFRGAGADALSIDATGADLTRAEQLDPLGNAVDAGVGLWLGVVPAVDAPISSRLVVDRISKLWNALGFAPDQLAHFVVPTTACGLAGATPGYVRRAFTVLREVGEELREQR